MNKSPGKAVEKKPKEPKTKASAPAAKPSLHPPDNRDPQAQYEEKDGS